MKNLGLSITELEELVAQLTIANETNRVIGAAIGIVMERGGLDYRSAYQYLVRRSQNTNTKLRLVAFELVNPDPDSDRLRSRTSCRTQSS